MKQYHKIQTTFKRDPENKFKTLLCNDYSRPEFEYLKNNKWVFTEKVDGMTVVVAWNGFGMKFGGKSEDAQIPTPLLNNLNETFFIQKDKFIEIFGDDNVCLYGEGYGGKIRKAGQTYGVEQRFVLFDVKIGEWWLQRESIVDISDKLNLDVVPIVGHGTLGDLLDLCKSGFESTWGDFIAEGAVARPSTELVARNGQRIITKLKYKDFPR